MLFQYAWAVASWLLLRGVAGEDMQTISTKDHIQHKIRRGEVPAHAVNLGGWLVAEGWMTYNSSLWYDVPEDQRYNGEYATMKLLGPEKGTAAFESHRSTWITETDIQEIAKAGLNTVRVPIGYWIVNDDPEQEKTSSEVSRTFAKGSLKYLDKVVKEWGPKYNLAVMVSLHAHEGSQNGLDHSAPVKMWKVGWSDSQQNVESSMKVASFIAHRYKRSGAFLGLNLMNEPTVGVSYSVLHKYYKDMYKQIRDDGNDCIIGTSPLLVDQGPPNMADFMPCPQYYNVWHEYHIYYKWGWEHVSAQGIISGAANYRNSHIDAWHGNPLFIGEWSLATPDTTPFGREELTKLGETELLQLDAAPPGWAFWAWRHDDENSKLSGWSMRQMLREGILKLPNISTVRSPSASAAFCPYNETINDEEVSFGSDADDSKAQVTPSKADVVDTSNVVVVTQPVKQTESGAGAIRMCSAAVLAMLGALAMLS